MEVAKQAVRVVGRYALYDVLAAGGMATVHLGRLLGPVGFSRTVAIKRLHPRYAGDPEFVSMFLEEARLVARIRHPNVVPMLDVVASSGELFLVMEYVPGESLARLAQGAAEKRLRVPPRVVVAILSGVLQGLHAAHEARDEHGQPLGIVHRDVSPQNMLVGSDGQARVLDFGIAKAAGRVQTTADGQVKGKVAYMAPEQLRGGDVTRKVDVYAAAVVLWELSVGRKLFQGENEGATLTKVLLEKIAPPSVAAMATGVPIDFATARALERLDAVTMRGLGREPADRFETAREMALALEGCVPPATSSEVSAWVEQVASSTLHRRAEEVTAIESGSFTNPRATLDPAPRASQATLDAPLPTVAPRAANRWGRVTAILVAAGALVVAVAAFLYVRTPASAPVSAASPSAPSARPSRPVATAAEPPPPVTASAVASAPPVVPVEPVATEKAPARASPSRHARPPAPSHPASGCDPPYTWDGEGRKHYKPECL